MATSQLINDLLNNAHDRLAKWVEDTHMRCGVVNIPLGECYGILLSCLTLELYLLCKKIKMSDNDLLVVLQNSLGELNKKYAEAKENP